MLSHVGNGKHATLLLVVMILAGFLSPAHSQGGWLLVDQVSVPPGESRIVLLEQLGLDLILRIRSNEEILLLQEGAEDSYGAEVAVLTNSTKLNKSFDIEVDRLLRALPIRYQLDIVDDFTEDDLLVASRLSSANSAWWADADANRALSFLQTIASEPINSKLRQIAFRTYIDALSNSGQSESVIEALSQSGYRSDFDSADIAYLDWRLADAQWAARHIDDAFTGIRTLADQYSEPDWLSEEDYSTVTWLRHSMQATEGGIRVFAGIRTGNEELMHSGGGVLKEALRSASGTEDYSLRGRLTDYLSGYYDQFEGRQSITRGELIEKAKRLFERSGSNPNLASILNNQAHAALGRGDFNESLRLYLEAMNVQKNSKHLEGKAHVRARLGYLYLSFGDFRNAEIRYEEAIDIYNSLGLSQAVIHTELEYANLLYADARFEEALTLLTNISQKIGSKGGIEDRLRLYTHMALNYLELGDIERAKQSAALATPTVFDIAQTELLLQRGSRLYYRMEHQALRGRVSMAEGDYAGAYRQINAGLNLVSKAETEPLQQLELLYLKMQISDRLGNIKEVIGLGNSALEIAESLRSEINFLFFGPQWASRTSRIRSFLTSKLLEQYTSTQKFEFLSSAFDIVQKTRAINLRNERLIDRRESDVNSSGSDRRALNETRQELLLALLENKPTEEIKRRLARNQEQYLLETNASSNITLETVSVSIMEVQENLNVDEVAATYVLGEQSSYLLEIRSHSIELHTLPSESFLSNLVNDSIAELVSRDRVLEATTHLANLIFPKQIAESIETRFLEVDGAISRIPFSVLLELQDNQSPDHLVHVPSLSTYYSNSAKEHADDRSSRHSLAVFADPNFSEIESQVPINVEPQYDLWRNSLGRLPFSRIEAESILEYFEESSTLIHTDERATISGFLSPSVRESRILHIASHGFASTSDPHFIGLAFTSDVGVGDQASGLLTTAEIGAYEFSNELVVISACETAQGTNMKGEGLMSLSRAFLASGAGATISTLWPVSDRANALFMENFYYALKALNLETAAALTYAQNKLKRSPTYDAPYYWGAFVLHVADRNFDPIAAN